MARVVRIHDGTQFCCAVLGEPGRKYTPYVTFGFPIRKRRLANRDAEQAPTLRRGKREYPLTQACNKLLRMGKCGNITKGAKEMLLAAKQAA